MFEQTENAGDGRKERLVCMRHENELISVAECAFRAKLNPSQVYRMLGRGEMTGFRFGKHWRIPWPECLDALRNSSPIDSQQPPQKQPEKKLDRSPQKKITGSTTRKKKGVMYENPRDKNSPLKCRICGEVWPQPSHASTELDGEGNEERYDPWKCPNGCQD